MAILSDGAPETGTLLVLPSDLPVEPGVKTGQVVLIE